MALRSKRLEHETIRTYFSQLEIMRLHKGLPSLTCNPRGDLDLPWLDSRKSTTNKKGFERHAKAV